MVLAQDSGCDIALLITFCTYAYIFRSAGHILLTCNWSITIMENDCVFLFIVVRRNIIIMYVGDEQSVKTPVTFVAPRPPPRRRILPHPSVQRQCMFAG